MDGSGAVVGGYYDRYGRSTAVVNTKQARLNFTALYQEAKAGSIWRFTDLMILIVEDG